MTEPTKGFREGCREILDGLSVVVEDDGRKVVLGKDQAISAIQDLQAEREAELDNLLGRWAEAFDDDGALDGYSRDYIKKLQRETYNLRQALRERVKNNG